MIETAVWLTLKPYIVFCFDFYLNGKQNHVKPSTNKATDSHRRPERAINSHPHHWTGTRRLRGLTSNIGTDADRHIRIPQGCE